MAEEKRKRGRPPKPKNPFTDTKFLKAAKLDEKNMCDPQVYTGENAKIMAHNLQLYAMPGVDTFDAKAVKKRTNEYFKLCAENDMRPSVAGYALALKVDRRTLWRWLSGLKPRPKEVMEVIYGAYTMLNAQMEDLLQHNKINPVSGIFLLKNNMGYSDQTEVVLDNNNTEKSVEELIAEAAALPDPKEKE